VALEACSLAFWIKGNTASPGFEKVRRLRSDVCKLEIEYTILTIALIKQRLLNVGSAATLTFHTFSNTGTAPEMQRRQVLAVEP
jgi:hypothetical protein